MNKFVVLVLLFLTVANAKNGLKGLTDKLKGISDGINKKANDLNKKVNDITDKAKDIKDKATDAIDQIEDAVEKTKKNAEDVKKAVDNTTKNIKRDFATLQADMKQLVSNIEFQFQVIATDVEKAILNAKKWYNTKSKDAKELYKNFRKEFDKYYSAVENDINIAAANAKNILNKFGADVSVLYKDGRLVVVEAAKDASAAIKALKKQNKESLEKSVAAINDSIEQAKRILNVFKKSFDETKDTMDRWLLSNSKKLTCLKAEFYLLADRAKLELNAFTANVKASVKKINDRCEELLKSAKALGTDLLGKNIVTEIKEEKSVAKSAFDKIKKLWNSF